MLEEYGSGRHSYGISFLYASCIIYPFTNFAGNMRESRSQIKAYIAENIKM